MGRRQGSPGMKPEHERYYVCIIALPRKTAKPPKNIRRVIERQGPWPYIQALIVRNELRKHMDARHFLVKLVADRAKYFAAYHKKRFKKDKTYRNRRRINAYEHWKKTRAILNGDINPWIG